MSSFFDWDSQLFELHISSMDEEHKKLISLMNLLYTKNENNSSKSDIINIINDLLEFVKIHFQHEENYMESIRYPKLNNHKSIHQRLLVQLIQHKIDFESSTSDKVSDRFFDFLALWLTAHIQHFDKNYSLWANTEQKTHI